ncbi:uncharacterized protein LOC111055158 isoform X2 [Nilaparvata lugens]|uniref:uncharacterized protein LOC111055158 isoform X2 n=1 Tax=Nilaparvata lugens TaxID=108931 RepID=UPI00193D9A89|nr:uncharacterized protein LOC111055158 isoform X2 [Nilaparvata lugens]
MKCENCGQCFCRSQYIQHISKKCCRPRKPSSDCKSYENVNGQVEMDENKEFMAIVDLHHSPKDKPIPNVSESYENLSGQVVEVDGIKNIELQHTTKDVPTPNVPEQSYENLSGQVVEVDENEELMPIIDLQHSSKDVPIPNVPESYENLSGQVVEVDGIKNIELQHTTKDVRTPNVPEQSYENLSEQVVEVDENEELMPIIDLQHSPKDKPIPNVSESYENLSGQVVEVDGIKNIELQHTTKDVPTPNVPEQSYENLSGQVVEVDENEELMPIIDLQHSSKDVPIPNAPEVLNENGEDEKEELLNDQPIIIDFDFSEFSPRSNNYIFEHTVEISNENQTINQVTGSATDEGMFLNNIVIIDATDQPANQPANQPDLPTYTKKGEPRKRALPQPKCYKKTKLIKQKEKHPLQPPCNIENCKRKCISGINEDRRQSIHDQFWLLNDEERKMFILTQVDRKIVSHRRNYEDNSRRSKTFNYFLKNNEGESMQVCKTFFITTLGYKKNNDTAVFNVLNQPLDVITPKPDRRGKHSPHNKIDRSVIEKHILKFNPCVHHYRREHAPERRYLPTDINIRVMHNDFIETHKNLNCSYELYRNVISEMKISFVKLGHEECERCETFQKHDVSHAKEPDEKNCLVCQNYSLHKKKYEQARKSYNESATFCKSIEYTETTVVVYSMDLQKVLMLPQIEQFKECLFTRRIIALNESFVPVGCQQAQIQPIACIWHEAISGRKQEDICSSIHKFLLLNRDFKKICLWMDNCSSQNKNWALFSYMVYIVNSEEIAASEIEFNYLEAGHTFMSADSFHHQVSKQLKLKGKVYDFEDFTEAVQNSNSKKVTVVSMKPEDFFLPFDYSSIYLISKAIPRPYLANMVQVSFSRGSLSLKYKTSFEGEQTTLKFLKVKHEKNQTVPAPTTRCTPRGVNAAKKDGILTKLLPLMPGNRKAFWLGLPVSDAPDLIDEQDC